VTLRPSATQPCGELKMPNGIGVFLIFGDNPPNLRFWVVLTVTGKAVIHGAYASPDGVAFEALARRLGTPSGHQRPIPAAGQETSGPCVCADTKEWTVGRATELAGNSNCA